MLHATPISLDDLHQRLHPSNEVLRFDQATAAWHTADTECDDLTLQLHRANFELWHLEDRARDTHVTDAVIAEVKRSIDRTNQRRNDLVEQLDDSLMTALASRGLPNADAPLHSETPGMMLDRLSILSLKRFHTREEAHRQDAAQGHRERNLQRLQVLDRQSDALAGCLRDLWDEVLHGTRRFALYRQMKMYNDPTTNPILYKAEARTPPTGS